MEFSPRSREAAAGRALGEVCSHWSSILGRGGDGLRMARADAWFAFKIVAICCSSPVIPKLSGSTYWPRGSLACGAGDEEESGAGGRTSGGRRLRAGWGVAAGDRHEAPSVLLQLFLTRHFGKSRAPWVPMVRRRLSRMPPTIVAFLCSASMGPAPGVPSLGACWTHDQGSGRAEDRRVLVVGWLLSFPMMFVLLVPRAPSRCPSSGEKWSHKLPFNPGVLPSGLGALGPVAWVADAASSLQAWPPALGSHARVSLPAQLVRGESPSIHSASH